MSGHPILPYMPVVFLPVSNLKRSVEWYCGLLERPMQPKQDGGGIYYFDLDGTDLILDSNMWGFPPMIMFDTNDIDAAYSFCLEKQYPITGDLQRFPDVAFFNVLGNMICQAVRKDADKEPEAAHPLLQRVCRVLVHADHIAESKSWYEEFLEKPAGPDPMVKGLPHIPMSRGAHLLIDDNRLSHAEKKHYDRLQLDLRVNPVVMIETPDIEAALSYAKSKGARVQGGIRNQLGLQFFTFYDIDDNGMMVIQK